MATADDHRAAAELVAQGLLNVLTPAQLGEYLALTTSGWEGVLASAESHSEKLKALEEFARKKGQAHYSEAITEFFDYMEIVLKNNADKSFVELMSRADIQQVFAIKLSAASEKAKATVTDAWKQGYGLGYGHANTELGLYGDLKGLGKLGIKDADLNDTYLLALLKDVDNNGLLAQSNFFNVGNKAFEGLQLDLDRSTFIGEGLEGIKPENFKKDLAARRAAAIRKALDKEGKSLGQKIGAGSSVAANRSYAQAQISVYEDVADNTPGESWRKVWVTNFSPGTCGWCAALHGTVLEIGYDFDPSQTFSTGGKGPGVYQDLKLPPRHPHCHCRIVLYRDSGKKTTSEPADLQAEAQSFADDTKGMAPKTWGTREPLSSLAKATNFIEARDIRRMSEGKFRQVVDTFRACLLRRRR